MRKKQKTLFLYPISIVMRYDSFILRNFFLKKFIVIEVFLTLNICKNSSHTFKLTLLNNSDYVQQHYFFYNSLLWVFMYC